ncbi:MAG: ABC transporter ATP-binding protein [Planctomycetota bacterium]
MADQLYRESDLAGVLVRVGHACDAPIEVLRARQLIRDAQSAWPADESSGWSRWLAEAVRSINLRVHSATLTVEEARRLASDGAAVIGDWSSDKGTLIFIGESASTQREIGGSTQSADLDLHSESLPAGPSEWLVVEKAERVGAASDPKFKNQPVSRFLRLLRPEWNDIWIILVFAFFAGVLSLATPIAVESLVNTVAFGRLLQPVVILALLLFAFLAFAAVMQAMQTYVAEIIQRRLFARVAADLAHRLPRVDSSQVNGKYIPELVNRFLDVVTLQKVVAQLLLDGVSIVLATLVGMTVLAFYHPWLLGFDILLLLCVVAGLWILGRGSIRSGIAESKVKYQVTSWFEDVVRCDTAFKLDGGADFAIDRANLLTNRYLTYREKHFGNVFRQIVFVLGLQAVAGTVLLGVGGWLVIQGQLTLGQLVAAELIVSTILSSLAKVGKHLEGFYDVIAAVDKLGALFDLPVERHDGQMIIDTGAEGLSIELHNVRVGGAVGVLGAGLSLEVDAGDNVAIVGPTGSGKSVLSAAIYGAAEPTSGRLTVAGLDPRDVRPDVLRGSVALVAEPEVFQGTVADNIHLRRTDINATKCRGALEAVGLLDECLRLPEGLDTELSASGAPFSRGSQQLLMFARAIAGDPRLLVIDSALDGLSDNELRRLLDLVLSPDRTWTLIVATGRADIANRFDRMISLYNAAAA